MLWNIVDCRANNYDINVDAVFEPSYRDNIMTGASQAFKDNSWTISSEYDITIEKVIAKANQEWKTPVTVFLYDAGSRLIQIDLLYLK